MTTLTQEIQAKAQIISQYEDQLYDLVLTEISRQFLVEYPDAEGIELAVLEAEPGWYVPENLTIVGGQGDERDEMVTTPSGMSWTCHTDDRYDLAYELVRDLSYQFMWHRWCRNGHEAESNPIRIDLHEQAAKYEEV